MIIQSIRKKPIRGIPIPPAVDNRTYREIWPELRLNMTPKMSTVTGTITIAIVDSGDPRSTGPDRDDDGHATLLEWLIRGRATRSPGLDIDIHHFKAFSAQGWPEPTGGANAIGRAAAMNPPPDVIVLAWDVGHTTPALEQAILAVKDQAVVVIAAGNWSLDNDRHPNWPANYGGLTGMGLVGMDHVITVMATDEDDERASYSSYGSLVVDVAAPGFAKVDVPHPANILRTVGSLRNSPSKFRGTSTATAHVALLAALVRVKHGLDPTQTKTRICDRATARQVPELKKRTPVGRLKSLCVKETIADFDWAL